MATLYTAGGDAPTLAEELALAQETRMKILKTGLEYGTKGYSQRRVDLDKLTKLIATLKAEIDEASGGITPVYMRRVQHS